MGTKKKNPSEESTSTLIKKTRNDISITGFLTPPGSKPFKLTVQMSSDNWESFASYFFKDKDDFDYDLSWAFILPVLDELRVKPRGVHKKNAKVIRSMRIDSRWMYLYFSWWKKKKRPAFMVNLEALALPDLINPDPLDLTHTCIQKIYGKEVPGGQSFYITYIQGDLVSLKRNFLGGIKPEVMHELFFSHPVLGHIVKRLAIYANYLKRSKRTPSDLKKAAEKFLISLPNNFLESLSSRNSNSISDE